MVGYDAGTTNPTLLNRLGDWRDREAWLEFVARYDPLIRSASRRFRLDADTAEELCQRVWIELARRMRTYRYDPGETFRGWLRRLRRSRAIDLLRKRNAHPLAPLDDAPPESLSEGDAIAIEVEVDAAGRSVLLRRAEEVQQSVRRRVSERSWRVFWSIAIEGQSIRETADAAGLSYYAAFAAERRVGQMLREAGRRLSAGPDVSPIGG